MEKQKLDLIDALKAFKHASVVLSEKWELAQDITDCDLNANNYPFGKSFDELTGEVMEWVDVFITELEPRLRYWIDLREDSDTFWIYKEVNGLVMNTAGLDILDSNEGLTEIAEAQYQAIANIWEDDRYDDNGGWRDRSRADDILDIVNSGDICHTCQGSGDSHAGGFWQDCPVCKGEG